MHLETLRLILRDPVYEDIEFSARLYSDPEITKYVGGPRSYEEMKEIGRKEVEQAPKDFAFWSVVEKGSKNHIGDAGLVRRDVEGVNEIELNYYLGKTHWGKGYATEIANGLIEFGLKRLQLGRIIALVHKENGPSRRVLEKIGMHLEKEVLTKKGNPRLLFSING
jgi:[ribosomal protein S5]-alanine N-acetyltransferase